jgi:5-methylthioadenosine/S-adenosylhomocysteine deaminase
MAFAARGPQFTTLDITANEFRRARELGLWGTTGPVVQLASRRLLGEDITYVHCNMLSDEDFRLIGDSGATASIAPEVELQMGHGFLATLSSSASACGRASRSTS